MASAATGKTRKWWIQTTRDRGLLVPCFVDSYLTRGGTASDSCLSCPPPHVWAHLSPEGMA
ncbi:unnamed protein product [Gulo gulo]|uniref:Uncharacterized protein n=1 Tax=Gulo gulo TaxID=48420 RepID=A0A9X9Q9T6_GULGU|nr:unnamed protein product [Gulo gulo]